MTDILDQAQAAVLSLFAALDQAPPTGSPDALVAAMAVLIIVLLHVILFLVALICLRPDEPRVDRLDPYAEAFGEIVQMPANMRRTAADHSTSGSPARWPDARGASHGIPSPTIAARSLHPHDDPIGAFIAQLETPATPRTSVRGGRNA